MLATRSDQDLVAASTAACYCLARQTLARSISQCLLPGEHPPSTQARLTLGSGSPMSSAGVSVGWQTPGVRWACHGDDGPMMRVAPWRNDWAEIVLRILATGVAERSTNHSRCVPISSGRGKNAQVRRYSCQVCKTVGSAYVGSNPTPATSKNPGHSLANVPQGERFA